MSYYIYFYFILCVLKIYIKNYICSMVNLFTVFVSINIYFYLVHDIEKI